MSCNYLNAELFLLSFHLCLLPLSMVRLSFSLCLSISHMCFLCLFSLFPDSPPFLSRLLSLSSFFLSVPCACSSVSQASPLLLPQVQSCGGSRQRVGEGGKDPPLPLKDSIFQT